MPPPDFSLRPFDWGRHLIFSPTEQEPALEASQRISANSFQFQNPLTVAFSEITARMQSARYRLTTNIVDQAAHYYAGADYRQTVAWDIAQLILSKNPQDQWLAAEALVAYRKNARDNSLYHNIQSFLLHHLQEEAYREDLLEVATRAPELILSDIPGSALIGIILVQVVFKVMGAERSEAAKGYLASVGEQVAIAQSGYHNILDDRHRLKVISREFAFLVLRPASFSGRLSLDILEALYQDPTTRPLASRIAREMIPNLIELATERIDRFLTDERDLAGLKNHFLDIMRVHSNDYHTVLSPFLYSLTRVAAAGSVDTANFLLIFSQVLRGALFSGSFTSEQGEVEAVFTYLFSFLRDLPVEGRLEEVQIPEGQNIDAKRRRLYQHVYFLYQLKSEGNAVARTRSLRPVLEFLIRDLANLPHRNPEEYREMLDSLYHVLTLWNPEIDGDVEAVYQDTRFTNILTTLYKTREASRNARFHYRLDRMLGLLPRSIALDYSQRIAYRRNTSNITNILYSTPESAIYPELIFSLCHGVEAGVVTEDQFRSISAQLVRSDGSMKIIINPPHLYLEALRALASRGFTAAGTALAAFERRQRIFDLTGLIVRATRHEAARAELMTLQRAGTLTERLNDLPPAIRERFEGILREIPGESHPPVITTFLDENTQTPIFWRIRERPRASGRTGAEHLPIRFGFEFPDPLRDALRPTTRPRGR